MVFAWFCLWESSTAQTNTDPKPGVYRVAVYSSYPAVFRTESGQVEGQLIRMLQEVGRQEGWQLQYVDCAIGDCIDQLKAGTLDIIPQLAFTYERSKEFLFTDEHTSMLWAQVYVRPQDHSQYGSLLSLHKKRVGVAKGSYFLNGPDFNFNQIIAERGIELEQVEYNNYKEVMAALEAGEIDAGVINRLQGELYGAAYGISKTPVTFSQFFLKMAISRQHPQALYLTETLSTSIAEMKADPNSVFMREHQKYFLTGNYSTDYTWLWFLLLALLCMVVFLIGVNRLLQRRVLWRTKKLQVAMDQLKEESRRSRLAQFTLDNAIDYVYWINEEGRFVYGNHAGMRLLGLESEDANLTIMDVVPTMTTAQWKRSWENTKQKKTWKIDFEVPLQGQKPVPIEAIQSYLQFDGREYICGIARDQSERIKNRKELMESQQRLELAIEGAREGIWDWDISSGKLHINEYIAEMLGYDYLEFPDNISGFEQLLHPEDLPLTRQALKEHFEGNTGWYELEYRIGAKDGHWHWVLVHGRVIERDQSGSPLRAIGTHVDIHSYKETTEELKHSHERIQEFNEQLESNLEQQTLIASVSGAFTSPEQFDYSIHQVLSLVTNHLGNSHTYLVLLTDEVSPQYHIFSWSRPGTKLVPNEELADFFNRYPDIYKCVYQHRLLVFAQGLPCEDEALRSWFYEHEQHTALLAPVTVKDKFCGVLVVADQQADRHWHEGEKELSRTMANIITNAFERKLIYQQLKHTLQEAETNRLRLGLAISAADMGIWEWHIASNETYYSPEYYQMLGYQDNEFVASYERWLQMVHPDDRESILDKINEQNEHNGKYLTGEYRMRKKSGEYIWVFDKSKTFFNEKRRPEAVIGILKDITDDKLAQEQLIATILETEDNERQRIAKELHDGLGQILTSISLNLMAVRKNMTALDSKNQGRVQTAFESINQAITDTRNISHNLMPGSVEDFGYVSAVESMVGAINAASDLQISFYHNLGKKRLQPAMEVVLFRISQEAINNILRHAQAKEVSLQLMRYEEDIILTVEDDGRGFDTDILSNNTGHFGLTSMENRATAAGGTLAVESQPGKGTLITVELPINKHAIYEANQHTAGR